MLRVHIQASHAYYPELVYTWNLLAEAAGLPYELTAARDEANLWIGDRETDHLYAPEYHFRQMLAEGVTDFRKLFTQGPVLLYENRPDYPATVFYLVNSIQEYGSPHTDELGRFRYADSYQQHFGNITDNVVYGLLRALWDSAPPLKAFPLKDRPSRVLLSHDIDSLYGAFMQDGMWALKNTKPAAFARVFLDMALLRHPWFNIDRIMDLESEHGFRSTFFWLVNQGRINARETNADYAIASKPLQRTLEAVEKRGFENGLHKSISPESFDDELAKLPVRTVLNRNHYLKFSLPGFYDRVEQSGIACDASLGFAEHYGFRNGYGYAFSPFDIKNRKPYTFKEVPLTCMDGTFQRYLGVPVSQTADTLIAFLEKNRHNALLSILWHNTFFTDHKYGGYLAEYKKILAYLYESGLEVTSYGNIIGNT